MKVKINNLDQLNDILFYAGFGVAKDSLVCIMNYNTVKKLTFDFTKKYKQKCGTWNHSWENPSWFANNNGVHFAVGEWLKDGEVDIKL